MKTTLFFYFLSILCIPLFSQRTISIPDVAFEEALIDLGWDTNGLNGTILATDAKYVINLNIENPLHNKLLPKVHLKIEDLTGIEHFSNLKRLVCYDNNITKLDLSQNKKLTFVNCSQNKITSLDVSNSPKLFSLSCDSNKITSLKIGRKPELLELYCNSNNIKNLNLKGCPVLEAVDISKNRIEEVLVSGTVSNNIPEGWYKDEKTTYVTSFGRKPIKHVKERTIEVVTANKQPTKKVTTKTKKTYSDLFKRSVVTEYEKNVLNPGYLQTKKEEIQRKYKMDLKEISKWIKEYGTLSRK